MTNRHQGKTIVISGAASGIGQASAIRLAEEGAQIVIADRAKADDTLQRIKAAGGSATAVQCDISDPASVAKLKEAVEKDGGAATFSSTTPASTRCNASTTSPSRIGAASSQSISIRCF